MATTGSSTSIKPCFNNQTHIDMCVRALRRVCLCAARARAAGCGLRGSLALFFSGRCVLWNNCGRFAFMVGSDLILSSR